MAGLPLVVFPHPLHSLNREQVLGRAREVVDEVIRALTTPADRLSATYHTRNVPARGLLKLGGDELVCEGDSCELR